MHRVIGVEAIGKSPAVLTSASSRPFIIQLNLRHSITLPYKKKSTTPEPPINKTACDEKTTREQPGLSLIMK